MVLGSSLATLRRSHHPVLMRAPLPRYLGGVPHLQRTSQVVPSGPSSTTHFLPYGANGKHFHLLLPGFFQLITQLHKCGRDFAVIFRSFGSDLHSTLAAVNHSALGHHPDFPHFPFTQVCLSPGKITNSKDGVALEIESHSVSATDGPRAAYNLLSNLTGICGLQDSYTWWARHGWSCHGGKPLLVDPEDPSVHHVFFDDNIRLEDEDSIVLPLVFKGPGPPQQVPTADLLGSCLIRTDLLAAIHNVQWFYERLCEAEVQYECYVHSLMHPSTNT